MALHRNCAGIARRDFIQIGLHGVLGLGLCDLLRLKGLAATANGQLASGSNVNCIMIWLDGGPSHYETFDPKPDAPTEVRGQFASISTSVPGVHFSECVPEMAKCFDKYTVVRSVCHKDPNHGGGKSLHDDRRAHACAGRVWRLRHFPSFVRLGRFIRARRAQRVACLHGDS
jgi:hypothetical protein